jgi:integrase/recombinase XerD
MGACQKSEVIIFTKKHIRIVKKIRSEDGVWRFVSLKRAGSRYIWDHRPGYYFLDWREGKRRCRELAGSTPSEATEAQRRKRNELLGELISQGQQLPSLEGTVSTPITDAIKVYREHVKTHSPDKPKTLKRYSEVLEHFQRLLGDKRYVEAITRAEIDQYKIKRSPEFSQRHPRQIAPQTINFEVSVLRTFFNYLINERGIQMANPCARFKPLKDKRTKSPGKPPTYTQEEIDLILNASDSLERATYGTFLLTGLRDKELCFLTWDDLDLKNATVLVSSKDGFSPKDYEERVIPLPPDLVTLLKELPHRSKWVFPNSKGGRISHLLRRLKKIAKEVGVGHATLHKFRHTYATRLLESGVDIVTVQYLLGHSDIETTRQYLDPREELKRKAANLLSLKAKD